MADKVILLVDNGSLESLLAMIQHMEQNAEELGIDPKFFEPISLIGLDKSE